MNRRMVAAGIIILLLVGVNVSGGFVKETKDVSTTVFNGKIIYVDDDNVLGPWDGTIEHPYREIPDAIKASEDGDTIFVFEGHYYSYFIIVNKSVNMIGENQEKTFIYHGIDVIANNTTITNFTIGEVGYEGIGICVYSSNNMINRNKILGFIFGIDICSCSNNNIIENNIIEFSIEHGIYLYGGNNTVKNNIISRCKLSGIEIVAPNYNNLVINNMIFITRNGIGSYGFEKNTIENNLIFFTNNGIYMEECFENQIIGNTIIFNIFGIRMEYSGLNIIKKNNCVLNFKPFSTYFNTPIYYLSFFKNYVFGNFARPSVGLGVIIDEDDFYFFLPFPIILNLFLRIIPYKGFNLIDVIEGTGVLGDK